jgi:hypothetical protein
VPLVCRRLRHLTEDVSLNAKVSLKLTNDAAAMPRLHSLHT